MLWLLVIKMYCDLSEEWIIPSVNINALSNVAKIIGGAYFTVIMKSVRNCLDIIQTKITSAPDKDDQ